MGHQPDHLGQGLVHPGLAAQNVGTFEKGRALLPLLPALWPWTRVPCGAATGGAFTRGEIESSIEITCAKS